VGVEKFFVFVGVCGVCVLGCVFGLAGVFVCVWVGFEGVLWLIYG